MLVKSSKDCLKMQQNACLMFEDNETSSYHIKLYKAANKFFERIKIDVVQFYIKCDMKLALEK